MLGNLSQRSYPSVEFSIVVFVGLGAMRERAAVRVEEVYKKRMETNRDDELGENFIVDKADKALLVAALQYARQQKEYDLQPGENNNLYTQRFAGHVSRVAQVQYPTGDLRGGN